MRCCRSHLPASSRAATAGERRRCCCCCCCFTRLRSPNFRSLLHSGCCFWRCCPAFLEARTAVVLSLFLPISAGVILALLFKLGLLPYEMIRNYFGAINFRMIAFPSIALDFYNDFFSTHDHHAIFARFLFEAVRQLPLHRSLSIVMARAYQLGNLNASLFATEGIASVGPILAPFAGLACGW